MMRQMQLIGERWFFKMDFQSRPAGKSILASDCELGIAKAQMGDKDFSVRGPAETRVEFPDALGHAWSGGAVLLEQVLRLILEMIEVRIGWEASYRHDELPFVCPRVRI
jgi:hypothetical protein